MTWSKVRSWGLLLVGCGLGLGLGGCAQVPTGPTVAVWPPPGKPLSVFQAEEGQCRQYASAVINPNASNAEAAKRVAIGTAAGAIIGGLLTGSGRGAGAGAAMGMLVGGSSAAQASERGTWSMQKRYNIAYEQCMYSKGNLIPGAPRPNYVPPPPPGT